MTSSVASLDEIRQLLVDRTGACRRDDRLRLLLLHWLSTGCQARLAGCDALPDMARVGERHRCRFIEGNRVWIRGGEFRIKLRNFLLGMLHLAGFTINPEQVRGARTSRIVRLLRKRTVSGVDELSDAVERHLAALDRERIDVDTCLQALTDTGLAHARRALLESGGLRRAIVEARRSGLVFLQRDGTILLHGREYEKTFAALLEDWLSVADTADPIQRRQRAAGLSQLR